MKLRSYCVVWGLDYKSYVKAMSEGDAIAKVQEDFKVLCPHAEMQIKDCYEVLTYSKKDI